MARRIVCLASLGLLVATASAQDIDNLAQELIELRGEVETLNNEIDLLQEEHRTRMTALAAQRADLEAQRKRQDIQVEQLQRELDENRERASQAGVSEDALAPAVTDAIAQLRTHIENGIPFKRAERLSELAEIETSINTNSLEPRRAVGRLWAFYEDEIRLTRDNGIYRQTISVDGRDQLADVAKLGTIKMYYRLENGRVGHAVKTGNRWEWRALEGRDAQKQVAMLFDSLRKQIRQGYFTLPFAQG